MRARPAGAAAARRRALGVMLAGALLVSLAGCAPKGRTLVVVTTNDVMAKTSPCGCHTPKGGLARRAAFLDSLRAKRGDVLVVDAGGFFPETDAERGAGPFMIAEVTFEDLGDGRTKYRAVARHWTEETKKQHEEMGFEPGWTQTAKQLEALAKTL